MKSKNQKIVFAIWIFLGLALIPVSVQGGISLGSAQDRKYAEVFPGESSGFKIFLFNIHKDSTLHLKLDAHSLPEGWSIDIEPKEFDLEYSEPGKYTQPEPGYEYLGLPGIEGVIKIRPVKVKVNVPGSEKPGDYEIKITASAEKSGGTLATGQERSFYFKIKVKKKEIPEEDTEEGKSVEQEEPVLRTQKREPAIEKPVPEKTQNITEKNETKKEEEEYEDKEEYEGSLPIDRITGMLTSNPYSPSITILIITLIIAIPLWLYSRKV